VADHPIFEAFRPLLAASGGTVVGADEIATGDIPVVWQGIVVGGVRLGSLSGALNRLITQIEAELGAGLADLGRVEKQAAVRMLDHRGAFHLRRAIEDIAERMGVSRITIYSYLNAIRSD
jgi:hypothetical protein